MAIENAKTLNVRIRNKYDSYENWAASSLVLEAGEIAIAYTTVDVKVDNGTAQHPALLMKVGDGEKTFANLPWLSAKAADVVAACKSEAALTAFVNAVIADAGIASDDAMEALAGRVTSVENDLNTATTGLKARVTTAEAAIATLNGLVGDTKVADQITNAINALNLADTYAAKVHKHEIADVNGLSDSIAAAKKAGDDAASALATYKTTNDAAVKVNSDAITAIKDGATIDSFADVEAALAGKQGTGDYSVNGHKHEIADVNGLSDAIADAKKAGTDAAAAAGQALIDAKAYADGLVGDKTVGVQITEALANYTTTDSMNSAIATAKGEAISHADGLNTAMDARVKVVEGKAHTHTFVESELNLIKTGDVAKWNAAEQNAKDYADDLDEAMDVRMQAVEAKLGAGEGGVDAQINAAVAAEAKLRDDADKALQALIEANDAEILALQGLVGDENVATAIENAVKAEKERAMGVEGGLETRLAAVEANYATDADVEGLQTQINTIMNNPDAEGAINSINEFTQYVKDHGTIADGMRTDINKNKEDVAGLITRMGAAETAIGTKAEQADLTALAGRVTTVEGDLNIETTGLKARMTAAEADIDALETKVGDKTVAAQIEAAIEALKIGDYAKAADLTAAINQHNTDKAALEADIAKKANDADLAAIAKSGSTDDLVQGAMTLVFDCGGASV